MQSDGKITAMKLLSKTTLPTEYISVNGTYGGNQGWFKDRPGGRRGKTLQGFGCGLIGAADILFYISGGKSMDASDNTVSKKKDKPGHNVTRDKYLDYVLGLEKKYFHILPKLGISGVLLALGMNLFFLKNRREFGRFHARWFVWPWNMLKRIKEMIGNGIPVLISVGPSIFTKDQLTFFEKKNSKIENEFVPRTHTKDHYVTITGVLEFEDRTMLEISSWGRKYYVNWDEYYNYVKKHDNFYFSNILYIRKK